MRDDSTLSRPDGSVSSPWRPVRAVLCAALVTLATGCGSDDNTTQPPGDTAVSLTQSGWTLFEEGNDAEALEEFDAAIAIDPDHGPAYIGQGWSRLNVSVNSTGLVGALTSFDRALTLQQSGAEVRAGRAATLLAIGGASLDGAITDARAARTQAPAFVFSHRTTFTAVDLLLVEAFALAGQAKFAESLAVADVVAPSGIVQGEPATWVVGSTTYDSFEEAALAYLHRLSNEQAG